MSSPFSNSWAGLIDWGIEISPEITDLGSGGNKVK